MGLYGLGYLLNAVVLMFKPNAIALGLFFVGNGIKFSATDSFKLNGPVRISVQCPQSNHKKDYFDSTVNFVGIDKCSLSSRLIARKEIMPVTQTNTLIQRYDNLFPYFYSPSTPIRKASQFMR